MAKISMKKAAQMFAVSRPTLAKHRDEGKISGEKVGDSWQFDTAELARVYSYRDAAPAPDRHADLTQSAPLPAQDLHGEIRVLQAKLEAAERLAEERARHIEDLRRMLPGPGEGAQDVAQRRRWWPWR